MSFLRIDRKSTITEVKTTDEGYLSVTAPIARTGVYNYLQPDGSIQREYIPPTTLFSMDSIETLRLKPVTNNHPSNFVNTDSYQELSVGSVGETIVEEGDKLFAKFMITQQDAIDDVNQGKVQLSPAYSCDLEFTKGISPDGEHYDAIQVNRKYNHLAIVDKARGGDSLNFKMDSDSDIGVQTDNNLIEGDSMQTIHIDGVDHKIDNEVVAKHISALTVRADNAEDALKDEKAEVTKLQAKLDAGEEKIAEMQTKLDSTEELDKRVDARVELLSVATSILGEDGFNKTDSDEAIMRAVVLKTSPKAEAKLDSADDKITYLKARFDSAIDAMEDDASAENRLDSADTDGGANEKISDARQKHIDAMENRWKGDN